MTDADTRLRWTLCGLVAWIRTPGVAHVAAGGESLSAFDRRCILAQQAARDNRTERKLLALSV